VRLFVQQLGASWPPLFASDEQVMAILGKEFPEAVDCWETCHGKHKSFTSWAKIHVAAGPQVHCHNENPSTASSVGTNVTNMWRFGPCETIPKLPFGGAEQLRFSEFLQVEKNLKTLKMYFHMLAGFDVI
jgi:hypothetical protein